MTRSRMGGTTLVELVSAMSVIACVILGSLSLMVTGLKGFRRTATDAEMSTGNSQTIRKMVENLRNATSVTVSDNGKRIDYVLPKYTGSVDATTGEKELMVPVQSDGVARAYVVNFTTKTVTDTVTGKTILKNLAPTDPDPDSTQYKKAYTPFVKNTAGSIRAVTINLITNQTLIDEPRFAKFKTTVIAHNYK